MTKPNLPTQQEFQQALTSFQGDITLKLTPLEAWLIFSNLQLALRHPANVGASSIITKKIALHIEDIFMTTPILARCAAAGWNPGNDVKVTP